MLLAKSIISEIINKLRISLPLACGLFLGFSIPLFSQDNSPYSRYGIGDLVPTSNISNRSMGGISAGYTDALSVNFSNPASFSGFQAWKEKKSNKLSSGRVVLDMAVNIDNRMLRDPQKEQRYTASNALFSYVQVGVPLRKNWGMSFGIRPISRISYKINRYEQLTDPVNGTNIDSSITQFEGDGGSYLGSLGTGLALYSKDRKGLEEKLSIGINAGYLFGRKNYMTRRSFLNDTVSYYQAKFQNTTNFGNLSLQAGLQYQLPLNKKIMLTIGGFGQLGQTLSASQDLVRETFFYDQSQGQLRLDSVSDLRDIKGTIELPASFTAGFVLQKFAVPNKEGGWMVGIDYSTQPWSDYRYYGRADSLRDKWELRLGAQISPVPQRSYFTNVSYRFGFFLGPDYIKVGESLPQFGASLGLGLPVGISRQAPNQVTFVNLAFEYARRGNSTSVLQENLFRVSLGFSLSDIWFIKRQYD
ncbi:MAG: hypothetical protein FJ340_03675 [Sphingomonadales bacterium]|nr:hypothetical protein [Sphingomonadales bacterium]